ncbi:uncharacterized protein [Haliotis cracherodii]|uniref:uncharacterized protein n=1 Tax=Haliotis cracherodii TaxID=6455 RepID=UPI0039ED768D
MKKTMEVVQDYSRLAAILMSWTVTAFICHQCAKSYLSFLGTSTMGYMSVSMLQLSLCVLTLTIKSEKEITSPWQHKAMTLACHVIATLATNYSLSLIHASSTFAIKMLEPITSAVIQWTMFSVTLPVSSMLTLPVIVSGAILFTGNPFQDAALSQGLLWALISNLALAFRNISMKRLFQNGHHLEARSKVVTITTTGTLLLMLCLLCLVQGPSFCHLGILATSSAVFHVVYTYLSVALVLKSVSVVTHAVINIFKRIAVVLMLCVFGRRGLTLINITGLLVSGLGLVLYSIKKNQAPSPTRTVPAVSTKGTAQRVALFLLPLALLCTATGVTKLHWDTLANIKFQQTELSPIDATEYWKSIGLHFTPEHGLEDFISMKYVDHPYETDRLSPLLTRHYDVIREAQRIHFNIFNDLIGAKKYAILFDVADYENKGDPAISTGEIIFLRKLGIQLIYYCLTSKCPNAITHSVKISEKYPKDQVIILFQGGGNMFSYKKTDEIREKVIKSFPNHQIICFPQSIWLRYEASEINRLAKIYNGHKDFTLLIRDRSSLEKISALLNNTRRILAPDMAFQMGAVSRFAPPTFDILWLKRHDEEATGYTLPTFPKNVTVHVADWFRTWPTARDESTMEMAIHMATNGLLFLQRGRVVIADRLHGHILSVLLGIPHVILDNSYHKVTSYHKSWTQGMDNVKVASTSDDALHMALEFLDKQRDILPPILQYHVSHD